MPLYSCNWEIKGQQNKYQDWQQHVCLSATNTTLCLQRCLQKHVAHIQHRPKAWSLNDTDRHVSSHLTGRSLPHTGNTERHRRSHSDHHIEHTSWTTCPQKSSQGTSCDSSISACRNTPSLTLYIISTSIITTYEVTKSKNMRQTYW